MERLLNIIETLSTSVETNHHRISLQEIEIKALKRRNKQLENCLKQEQKRIQWIIDYGAFETDILPTYTQY